MEKIIIRNETEKDFREVENITREAFWNFNVPGCDEHYLVHTMRSHKDFLPKLDYVAELDGKIVGNVMYTKCQLIGKAGEVKDILTFGPLSVLPAYQRCGIGKALLEASFVKVVEMGYDAIVIFGHPSNYISRGFVSCKKHNICLDGDFFPSAMLVKELVPDVFDGRKWVYCESSAYHIESADAEEFDKLFEPKEKKYQKSQEEFFINSHSSMQ